MKIIKNLTILFIFLIINKINALAATGLAQIYQITIQQIALCETNGSSLSLCSNPVVVYESDSGPIDIASTSAGSAAASLGSATKAVVGTSYSHVQVVMNRLITIGGSGISDGGGGNCGTTGGTAGTAAANGQGVNAAAGGALVVAAGVQGSPMGNAGTPLAAVTSDSTAGAGANGNVGNHAFFSWRVALTNNFIYDGIRNPTIKIAFDTANALGFSANAGACDTVYADAPSVSVTIK